MNKQGESDSTSARTWADKVETRFMVVAQARSGSTFLCELLNRQRDVTCHGEVFSRIWIDRLQAQSGQPPLKSDQLRALLPLRDADPLRFMQTYVMAFPGSVTGFKIVYDDFLDQRFCQELTFYARRERLRIIHLRRLNDLAALVSRNRMSRFGIRHSDRPTGTKSCEKAPKISVPPSELARYAKRQASLAAQIDGLFPDALQVRYENLNRDFPRILDHLGLSSSRPFVAPLRKLAPVNLADVVENYAELAGYDRPEQPNWT